MLSVLGAVAGVADQPLQGLFRAESVSDVTSGLITGVGKGLIGVVTKPLGGAMELVSQTGQGILQGTGLGELPTRIYEAQDREDAVGSSSNLKYLW
jgi:vacuolar protein sorting-associated protein 13B